VAGRAARRLTGTPRPSAPTDGSPGTGLLDRVDLLVDDDTGIVLRWESVFGGQPLEIAELRDFAVDPPAAHEPAWFRPAPGVPDEDSGGPAEFRLDRAQRRAAFHPGEPLRAGHVGVILAAGAVRLAAGQAARPAPPREASPDPDAAMPAESEDGAEDGAVAAGGRGPGGNRSVMSC